MQIISLILSILRAEMLYVASFYNNIIIFIQKYTKVIGNMSELANIGKYSKPQ